ncbi:uncharacterized protein LOC115732834 [Rhodamnia argentea]|uniref:Uncharacterized protein LOC115732834 n=1 Tax=Rhodamnia argentea TaxID=178133 RepID=A0A8B8NAB4_9MYRT|nr:uncharacterized protein LOC115732834 [Rhodamnia argentea]
MRVITYSDTVLVPLSLFLTVGYHAYLWHSIKRKPSVTTIGHDVQKRKAWFLALKEGDEKAGMLAVQSTRNTLMVTILTASIAILINLALAALTNNAYDAAHLFGSTLFGSKSPKIFALKYGSACFFSSFSFLCSSMAVGYLIDANFLINATPGDGTFSSSPYTQVVFERGFLLALFGNRLLCMTFPLLMWMFGPVPVALSSGALVWGLYELDFARRSPLYADKNRA